MFASIVAYLLLVLIRPQDYPDLVERIGLPLLPIALVVAALFWLPSARKRFDAPQYPVLLLFFGAMMLSNVANGWLGGALERFERFAPTVLAFLVLAHATDSPRRVRLVMGLFATCAAVLALHGIEQAQVGMGWTGIGLSQGTRIQYVGIFNDPNDLGMLFVTCVPMAAYLSTRGGWMGLARLYWLAVVAVLAYGIYLTDSRGTILAMLVVAGIYLWWRRGLLVAGACGAAALGVLMTLPTRMQELDVSEASAAGRVDSWYEGVQMFRANPVFGVGADMYTEINPLTAHNSFVLVLAETGIVGFCLWLAFVGYCFRMMLAGVRQPPPAWADTEAGQGTESPAACGVPAGRQDAPARAFAGAGTAFALAVATGDGTPPVQAGPIAAWPDTGSIPAADAEAGLVADPHAVEDWYEDRDMALTLLLSLCGFFTAAFFLSRSYVVLLYLLAALVVAHYTGMRDRNPELPAFGLQRDLVLWPAVAVAGAGGLFLMVKVLLVLSA